MNKITAIQTETQDALWPAAPMLALLERVALKPELPVERLVAIMDMQERQMNKVSEQQFNRSFASAMAEMPAAKKTGMNKHTKQTYSTLADLVEAARPSLSNHGLALNWRSSVDSGLLTVTAIVRHDSGWKEETSMSAPVDAGKGQGASMNSMQAYGSTETYLKRYTGFAILGMSSEDFDDDAQGTSRGSELVSAEQYIVLRDKAAMADVAEARICLAHGCADLQQFPAKDFKAAIGRLDRDILAKSKVSENV